MAPALVNERSTEEDRSWIELTTGLKVKKQLVYVNSFDDGDGNPLSEIARNIAAKESILVIERADKVYWFLPLKHLKKVERSEDGQQLIELDSGEKIAGLLVGSLRDSEGKSYDLASARQITVISLAKYDSEGVQANEDATWQLELAEPFRMASAVADPRFAYLDSTINFIGTWRTYSVLVRSFYLVDSNGTKNLANVQDFDAIRLRAEDNTVTTELNGEAISGKLDFIEQRGLYSGGRTWFLVAGMAKTDITIAIPSSAKPVIKLTKASAQAK